MISKASARRKRGGSASSTTPPTPISTPIPITTTVATPRLTAAAKGKQPARATSPTDPLEVERTEAEQLKIVLRRSRRETYISQHGGSSTDEGTGSIPGVPDEEESFDLIPRTLKDGEDDGDGEDDQGLRISEEERMHEEEEAEELYRDVDINQGMGLQVSQDIDDSHVTLTPIHFDGQESSSTSSFVTSLLNPIIDLDRMKSLEVNFSKFMRTNQSPEAVSNIPGIVHQYMRQEMKEAVRENLYKALVKAYDADKTILDSYGESAILKRRCKDDDDQEGSSAGSDRGSKRQREGGEHASANTSSEPVTGSAGMSTTGTQSRLLSTCESAFTEEPMRPPTPDRDWNKTLPDAQGNAQSWISALAKQTDARSSFNELLDTLIDFSNFIMNRIDVDTLTPELLASPTYELMRGSSNSLTELEYHLEERRVEDLQLRVESYQKMLNLTKPDTYRSDLKRREAYTAYSNPRGFIYQNKDKKNRLMRIDELYKFSDRTLNDVRNALDDRLKGIRMQYLPTTI
nr:hypothetical protein [Tanacetum cinerariifolium]